MNKTALIIQSAVAITMIVAILIQQRGTALGSAFGSGQEGFYLKKRGFEKTLFVATIILATIFIAGSIVNLVV